MFIEIQIIRPLLDLGAGRPTVNYMAAISTNWVPGLDQLLPFVNDW